MPQMKDLGMLVRLDLKDKLSAQEVEWLESREVVVLWLQELHEIYQGITHEIMIRKRQKNRLAPHRGKQPSHDFIEAKRSFDEWKIGMIEELNVVSEKIKRAKTLVVIQGLDISQVSYSDTLLKLYAVIKQRGRVGLKGAVLLDEIESILNGAVENYVQSLADKTLRE